MDELTKLKASAYDLVAQIQQLQRMLDEHNNKISVILEKQSEVKQSLKSNKYK